MNIGLVCSILEFKYSAHERNFRTLVHQRFEYLTLILLDRGAKIRERTKMYGNQSDTTKVRVRTSARTSANRPG